MALFYPGAQRLISRRSSGWSQLLGWQRCAGEWHGIAVEDPNFDGFSGCDKLQGMVIPNYKFMFDIFNHPHSISDIYQWLYSIQWLYPWGSNVGSICWHLRNTLFSDVRRPYLMSVAKFWLHLRETYFPVNLLELKGPCVHQKLQLIIDITLHPNNIYLLPGNLGVHPIPSAADLPAALSHGAPHRHPKLGWRELELVSGSWCCSPSVFFLVVLWYVYVYYIYNWSNGFP
jgi:hypothetical protein